MKTIKVFDVREDEKKALQQWIDRHQHEVKVELTEEPFGERHFNTLAQIDGISTSQTTSFNNDYLQVLSDHGIQHIAQRSAGFDMFDLEAAQQYGITISNVPSYSPQSIAEFAVTRILELVRHTHQIDRNVAENNFTWDMAIQGRTLASLKVGVLGTGRIGSRVAKILHGFGTQVYGYDLQPDSDLQEIVNYVDSVEALVQDIDVLTVHIPGSKDNQYVINSDVFRNAQKGLIFINTARGVVVETTALIEALDAGIVRTVALDTYENEGPYFKKDYTYTNVEDEMLNHLIERQDVLVSPHVAFFTDEAVQNLVDIPLDDVLSYIKGDTIKNNVMK
ncbi:D-2-hydroxyacid dehydrogenase [Staphylococcus sp. 11261D007BR]